MLFTDPIFLFYFLPFALLLHSAIVRTRRGFGYPTAAGVALFSLTLAFYGFGEPWWLIPFAVGIIFDFLWAALLHRTSKPRFRRMWVTLSVVQNLSMLVIFKYWDFVTSTVLSAFPTAAGWLPVIEQGGLPLALPAGISFYTFESLSFVIDVYRRHVEPPKRPIEFFTFIGMFPRFIAGPIVRYKDLSSQFKAYTGPELSVGLGLFAKGLFLKCCLADSFAIFASYAFGRGPVDFIGGWIGVLAYTMQIYFDFFGYSLMAIGLGRCLGFRFPDNFNRPYFSENITDFWRRWHITLGTWLRDYLYISLGGNRCSPWKHYRNLFATMALGGLWHGASWNFLLWGSYHGMLLCLEHRYRFLDRFSLALRRLVTFVLVLIGWIPFRAANLREAAKIFRTLFNPFNAGEFSFEGIANNPVALFFCCVGIAYLIFHERKDPRTATEVAEGKMTWVSETWKCAQLASAILVTFSSEVIPFIYFRF